ncbi:MAG: hypothetical protein ACM3N0_01635, partial [Chloroflexota bacterium]
EPDKYKLPDVVADLHGPASLPVQITLIGHVDSVPRRAHGERVFLLRNTFSSTPDAPVSEFTLEMQGGRKGLFENSTDLCRRAHRAGVAFRAQNGKLRRLTPKLVPVACRSKKHR